MIVLILTLATSYGVHITSVEGFTTGVTCRRAGSEWVAAATVVTDYGGRVQATYSCVTK